LTEVLFYANMLSNPGSEIRADSLVSEIVTVDYRTADVFRKYDIEYCCGGKWPLFLACEARGLDVDAIKAELEEATRTINLPGSLQFAEWDLDFLADYIIHVHHHYLKKTLPSTRLVVRSFIEEHRKKYPVLTELQLVFDELVAEMIPHLQQEEEIIFPYIKQINHAYHRNESYAGLLVRTLRKPVEDVMQHEHESVTVAIHDMRRLTNNYTPPENACVNHRVCFSKLREIDHDLVQHMHLENNILFPRAIALEKELLSRKDLL